MKSLPAGGLAGRVMRALLVALALLAPCRASHGERSDAEAGNLYEKGVKAIRNGAYREGIKLMEEALGRGATEPNDQQGDSRFPVTRYDPYYWLGIAQMGLGDDEKALINFQKSKNYGAIKAWKNEWRDLNARLEVVRKRLDVASQPASPPDPGGAPSPAEPVAAAFSTPTPAAPVLVPSPSARPENPQASAGRPSREAAAAVVELNRLGGEIDHWLAMSGLDEEVRRRLTLRRNAVWKALSNPRLSPLALSRLADDERKAYVDRILPALRGATLSAALAALQRKDWALCDAAMTAARRTGASPAIDIVDVVRHATRYLLAGRRDRRELDAARFAFRSWRTQVGPDHPIAPLVSPTIRALLAEDQNR